MERTRELLEAGCAQLAVETGPEQLERLVALTELLHHWSRSLNLTGHRTLEAIASRLVLEAVALQQQIPALESLADIGSGAGIPGLPIAILRPSCEVTLIESRERRHHFQRAAIRELALPNAEALRGRAEQLEPVPHAGAIAQAVAVADALPLLVRWTAPNGLLLLPGSEQPVPLPPDLGLQVDRQIEYRAPGGPTRTLRLVRSSR